MFKNEILKDLFFIERGYLNGNHFVYRSKAPILIDTGYFSGFNETAMLITGLGINLSDVSLIINTHSHCDHIGGNKIIQQKSGCNIALHKAGKYFIDTRDDWSIWWSYYDQEADFFDCTQALDDGETIAVGSHEFQVIYTPGHASDGIVLYNSKEKILISSDTLWENDLAVMTMRVEGSMALFHLQESLQKLESLDVKTVYPGHGRPFTDIKKAISKSKAKIKRYLLHRDAIGADLIKKIIVYTLLMKKSIKENTFFSYLMGTYWFKETVDLYFNSEYELKYNEIINAFIDRGIIRRENGDLFTTVKRKRSINRIFT
ncbi:MAG: MBL fold metallo-hydrolase [Deltaproteobacteria bacterium]|nr:MBL fold metallo-hydrolase [Deltaproteobacteria bacterium]